MCRLHFPFCTLSFVSVDLLVLGTPDVGDAGHPGWGVLWGGRGQAHAVLYQALDPDRVTLCFGK